ncbi:MAG: nicotinamide riboside transporter PnuC [Sphingobacteriales bacterium JAD_PAG50586_3]|nr:MAG: nicotinamide riboside transporter PnuC [Sphingobacteriales bacterium JAD_PAG50586_3]
MAQAEWAAFLLSLVYVVLNARQNIWCWPVGAASVIVYAWVFYTAKLYADSGLQIIYFMFSMYGWLSWKSIHNAAQKPIKRINLQTVLFSLAITAVLFGATYYILITYTDGNLPVWDSLAASLSLTATYLSARKYIINWPLWIFTNLLYVAIYIYKDLQLTATLSALMAILAIWGWIEWRKESKATQN